MRQSNVKTQHVVDLLVKNRLRVDQIAVLVGMSRQAVWKRLKSAGVTSRDFVWFDFVCSFCGAPGRRRTKQAANNAENYCNTACYYASRENPGYHPWRKGQRLARAIVAQYFKLEPEHVVDHRDGDNRNNNLNNLRVYASQSDHMKMHHGKSEVEALWDGSWM